MSDITKVPMNRIDGLLEEFNIVKQLIPVGSIQMGPVTDMEGYLLCNGQAVSRTQYADLFSKIGTNFGVGDGETTFNLPDYRGCFLRGFGGNSAANMYTKQETALPNITGSVAVAGKDYLDKSGVFSDTTDVSGYRVDGSDRGSFFNNRTIVFDASDSSSVYQSNVEEARPVNYAVNYFIKY